MPKKYKEDGHWTMDEKKPDPEFILPVVEEPEEPAAQTVYYEPVMWKNIKPVFRCVKCGANRDTQDDMILHVVSHLPADEQLKIFDQLMKEK